MELQNKQCEWITYIDGKVTKLKGKVTSEAGDLCIVIGHNPITGFRYMEIVDKSQLTFKTDN